MPTTTLDTRTALVLIDLQNSVIALPTAHPTGPVVRQAAALAHTFRRHRLPVVLVRVEGGAPGRVELYRGPGERAAGWNEFAPELDQQPGDHVVTKRTWGAFTNTDLAQHLAHLGVTQLVIGGIATSIGVESTARYAHELGFNVTLAIDAMTDLSAEAHLHSVTRIFPRLGETGSAQQIIDLLDRRADP